MPGFFTVFKGTILDPEKIMFATQWKAPVDRVVFERIKRTGDRVTDAGIILPEKVGGNVSRGKVLAAGPDAHGVEPGDIILFATKAAIQVDGEVFAVYANDIFGINRETTVAIEDAVQEFLADSVSGGNANLNLSES